jgi:hypothetical protein
MKYRPFQRITLERNEVDKVQVKGKNKPTEYLTNPVRLIYVKIRARIQTALPFNITPEQTARSSDSSRDRITDSSFIWQSRLNKGWAALR